MSAIYAVGPFKLDSDSGTLSNAGNPTSLGARGVAVLSTLVERANQFVSKSGIIDAAWPGLVVEESNLSVQISAIRRVLAQTPGGEHWIETLPRRGYRFVGPVSLVSGILLSPVNGRHAQNNLPGQLTSFIGRERELVEIKWLLPDIRVLTLVGAGGIGKTRLALQVAAEVVAAYRDGVWLVDLAPLVDPALVPSAVAQMLGVREVAGKPLIETLCSQLQGRQMLLLLDNCEHLLEACASLADRMLRSAEALTIIATSREPLRVLGEQIYPLTTLSLPDRAADLVIVTRSEAVQLFVDRARRQQPNFKLTSTNFAAVALLCIRLDGIPLALELAAARITTLSIEQIDARLDDRFKLLTRGDRAGLPRHQTLRALIDWSYNLLTDPERALLRRLSVFAGGWTIEAADAVGAGGEIDTGDVLDLLMRLVDKSLVISDVDSLRFRLLDTVRAYALEKLVEGGEIESCRCAHAQYFRVRFDRAPDEWLRMPDEAWRAIYLPDLDNVRAVLDWALGSGGDLAIALALAGASAPMWFELTLFDEGVQRLDAARALITPDSPGLIQARLWKGLATLWSEGRSLEKAADANQRAAELYRHLDHPLGHGFSLVSLALAFAAMGRLDQARSSAADAFPYVERADAPSLWGHYFKLLGSLHGRVGDPAVARTHYARALSFYQMAGVESQALAMLNNLVDIMWVLGDLDAALDASHEALALLRKSQRARKTSVGICLVNLAGLQVERGEIGEALAAAQEGLPLLKEAGMVSYPLDHLALRAALAGKLSNAARLAGFTDKAHAERQRARAPNEARAQARLAVLLSERLAADHLESLLAEGASLSEDEACRLALQE